jgi:serine/threonine protein kinase
MAEKNKPDPNATRLGSDEPAKTQVADSSDTTRFVETSESRGVDYQPGVLIKNRYELIREIGRGGMGFVWQARDTQFKRLGDNIALKFILSDWVTNTEAISRFKTEALVSLKLNQQNIINVRDIDQEKGTYFLVMEYLEGQDLRVLLNQKGRLELEEAENIFLDVCNALDYAHSSSYKLIHRDLKPQNIFICSDGKTKVMDFGIAKILDKETMDQISSLTRSGQSLGTLEYMAPEQRKGLDTMDARSDIYSLGLILYEMLTGELPVGIFEKPSEVTDGKVPKAVDAVIDQCIAQRIEKRFSSVEELKDAFLRATGKIKDNEGSMDVEKLYLQACERVYLDGIVDSGERATLNEMKSIYNLTDKQAEEIENKVREKYPDIVEKDTTAAPSPDQSNDSDLSEEQGEFLRIETELRPIVNLLSQSITKTDGNWSVQNKVIKTGGEWNLIADEYDDTFELIDVANTAIFEAKRELGKTSFYNLKVIFDPVLRRARRKAQGRMGLFFLSCCVFGVLAFGVAIIGMENDLDSLALGGLFIGMPCILGAFFAYGEKELIEHSQSIADMLGSYFD